MSPYRVTGQSHAIPAAQLAGSFVRKQHQPGRGAMRMPLLISHDRVRELGTGSSPLCLFSGRHLHRGKEDKRPARFQDPAFDSLWTFVFRSLVIDPRDPGLRHEGEPP